MPPAALYWSKTNTRRQGARSLSLNGTKVFSVSRGQFIIIYTRNNAAAPAYSHLHTHFTASVIGQRGTFCALLRVAHISRSKVVKIMRVNSRFHKEVKISTLLLLIPPIERLESNSQYPHSSHNLQFHYRTILVRIHHEYFLLRCAQKKERCNQCMANLPRETTKR
jgi:hypothetical protein